MDGPGIESRWGRDFPQPSRPTPESHSASYIMGTGSFLGVKRPGRGADHPLHLVIMLNKEQSYTSTPTMAFMASSSVRRILPFHYINCLYLLLKNYRFIAICTPISLAFQFTISQEVSLRKFARSCYFSNAPTCRAANPSNCSSYYRIHLHRTPIRKFIYMIFQKFCCCQAVKTLQRHLRNICSLFRKPQETRK